MGYHTPSGGESWNTKLNAFLGIVWISIPKCYGWKSILFQTDNMMRYRLSDPVVI
jgi:hypothetical protein